MYNQVSRGFETTGSEPSVLIVLYSLVNVYFSSVYVFGPSVRLSVCPSVRLSVCTCLSVCLIPKGLNVTIFYARNLKSRTAIYLFKFWFFKHQFFAL